MTDLYDILKFIDKNQRTWQEIKTHFNWDNDQAQLIWNQFFGNTPKYVAESKRRIGNTTETVWYISHEGKIYLRENSPVNKWVVRNQLTIAIITVILSVFGSILITGYTIQQNREFTATIDPNLEFFPDSGDEVPELSAFTMSRMIAGRENGQRLRLCVKNRGQTESGRVTAEILNQWSNNNIWNFENVKFGKPECDSVLIRNTNCVLDINAPYKECPTSEIPNGITYLILKVTCTNCNSEEKTSEIPIEVCVWHNDSAYCDKINNK